MSHIEQSVLDVEQMYRDQNHCLFHENYVPFIYTMY